MTQIDAHGNPVKGFLDKSGKFHAYSPTELAQLNKAQQALDAAVASDAIRDERGNVIGFRSDPPGTPPLDPNSPDYQQQLQQRKNQATQNIIKQQPHLAHPAASRVTGAVDAFGRPVGGILGEAGS